MFFKFFKRNYFRGINGNQGSEKETYRGKEIFLKSKIWALKIE
jgi:hypothetical protein